MAKYEESAYNLKVKYQKYIAAKEAVTSYHDVIDLDPQKLTPITSCENVYKRVVGPGVNEDTPFTLSCEHLEPGEICNHRKCDWFAAQMDYVMATEAYMRARKEHHGFIRGLLGRTK